MSAMGSFAERLRGAQQGGKRTLSATRRTRAKPPKIASCCNEKEQRIPSGRLKETNGGDVPNDASNARDSHRYKNAIFPSLTHCDQTPDVPSHWVTLGPISNVRNGVVSG